MVKAILAGADTETAFAALQKKVNEEMEKLREAEVELTDAEKKRAKDAKGAQAGRGQQNAPIMGGGGRAGAGGGAGGGGGGKTIWDAWQNFWQMGNQAVQPFKQFMPRGAQQAIDVANQWNNQMDAMMAPFNKMVDAFQQGQKALEDAEQLQQEIANDPMLNPIGFALQGGADLWEHINEQFKTDPKGALKTARDYIKAQIQQTLFNVSQATGDPTQYSFGTLSQPDILPVNLNQALTQNPQAAATVKMFEDMLAKLDEIEKHLGKTPHMAAGGIVTNPTFALIGENGPEAVIPLSGFSGTPLTAGINTALARIIHEVAA